MKGISVSSTVFYNFLLPFLSLEGSSSTGPTDNQLQKAPGYAQKLLEFSTWPILKVLRLLVLLDRMLAHFQEMILSRMDWLTAD